MENSDVLISIQPIKAVVTKDTPLPPSRVKSITRSDLMEYKSELHTWNHNLPEISINGHKKREKIKFDKGLSIIQTCIKTRYTIMANCLLHIMTFRLVTHSDCLHLSNTQLKARQKTKLLKLHNGLWCWVCAPYKYVPLSHLGNIVLTNEIATFHNGGISSSKCATLIISVFFLLQKIMKNVLLSISFQMILLLFIYSICSRKEATFASQNDL